MSNIITVNEQFQFERDKHGWKLYEWRLGLNKQKEPEKYCDTTYPGTLKQVCQQIIERSAAEKLATHFEAMT